VITSFLSYGSRRGIRLRGVWKLTCRLCPCGGTAFAADAPKKGSAVLSSVDATATVMKIAHKTREVTLKAGDGREATFVVDTAVKNLDQVKKGDVVTATYTEAPGVRGEEER
jgi:hypothetical protein